VSGVFIFSKDGEERVKRGSLETSVVFCFLKGTGIVLKRKVRYHPMSLQGKVAIVTGSTSGIGFEIALSLGSRGCKLVINGSRSEGEARDTIEKVRATTPFVVYCQADFTTPETAAKRLVECALSQFGGLDILVNNAGLQHVSPIEDFPVEKWDVILAVNLSSAFHTIKLAVPVMKQNPGQWGRIINISSVHGLVASANKSAYCAAKHGLNGLTKVVALELAETAITCNSICPGWVHTPLVEKQVEALADKNGKSIADAAKELVAAKQPSKRFTTTAQIAEMVVFLCGEGAGNMTGAEIQMDGGWTIQ